MCLPCPLRSPCREGGKVPSPHTGSPHCAQVFRTRLTQTIRTGAGPSALRGCKSPPLPLPALRPPCPASEGSRPVLTVTGRDGRGSGEGTRRGMQGSGQQACTCVRSGVGVCACAHGVHICVFTFMCTCLRVTVCMCAPRRWAHPKEIRRGPQFSFKFSSSHTLSE